MEDTTTQQLSHTEAAALARKLESEAKERVSAMIADLLKRREEVIAEIDGALATLGYKKRKKRTKAEVAATPAPTRKKRNATTVTA